MYSTTNNQTTRKIYDLLDSIKDKLSKSNQVHKNLNQTHYPNINIIPSNETTYILRNTPQNITTDNIRYIVLEYAPKKELGDYIYYKKEF